jgi:hypothetical protein
VTTVALAGRRIDAPGGPVRFPLERVDAVEAMLRTYYAEHGVAHLVSSAACGADLLALRAAADAGVARRTVVLPFDVATFRRTSVTDRPGDWGALYERIVGEVAAAGGLVVLGLDPDAGAAYDLATEEILAIAATTAGPVRACLVWEGASRGAGDHSLALADGARRRGWPVDEVYTLGEAARQPPDSALK